MAANRDLQNRWFGWWYVCIGLGFIALALRSYLGGARPTQIILRGVVAAGFLILGASTLKAVGSTRKPG